MKLTVKRLMDLIKVNPDMFSELDGSVKIAVSDGDVICCGVEAVINSYVWELCDVEPLIPITKDMNITNFYSNGLFSDDALSKAISYIRRKKELAIGINSPNLFSRLNEIDRKIMLVYNNIYNFNVGHCDRGISSVSFQDMLDVYKLPELVEARKKVEKVMTQESIDELYQTIERNMQKSNSLIAIAYRANLLKRGNFHQIFGSRGFVSDMNGEVYPIPVTDCFMGGFSSVYSMLLESTSTSIALRDSTTSISLAETFSRRLGLVSMYIRNLHPGDCGSTRYMQYEINDEVDLKLAEGVRYVNDSSDTELKIIGKDKSLIGKTVHIRNPATCRHPDKYGKCTTCMGDISFMVSRRDNLGLFSSTSISSPAAQAVLSKKHNQEVSSMDIKGLSGKLNVYLELVKDGVTFKKNLLKAGQRLKMYVGQDQVKSTITLQDSEDVERLNPNRVTRMTNITLSIENSDGTIIRSDNLNVMSNNKPLCMSLKMLKYVTSKNRITITSRGDYCFDVTGLKSRTMLMSWINKEFDTIALVKEISDQILSRTVNAKTGLTDAKADRLLSELYEITKPKLKVHISALGAVVSAFIANDLKNGDTDLCKPNASKDNYAIPIQQALSDRSISAVFLFTHMVSKTVSPKMLDHTSPVPTHFLDLLFKKSETLDEFNREEKRWRKVI